MASAWCRFLDTPGPGPGWSAEPSSAQSSADLAERCISGHLVETRGWRFVGKKERRLERKENSDHQTWIPHLSEFPEKKRKSGDLMSCQLRFHRCLPSNYCTLPYLDVTIDQTSKKSPPFPTLSMCSASTSQCHSISPGFSQSISSV